ncbi:HAMP domain-containing histidine kinase [Streptomyces actuosus]|uniref:Signal transduction histidine-protein kinase/phosphatase MprB n=1 Tax=Streptomyces actuosus TaxID=1885 RepID=A0ABS2VNH4_STRAS|nr:HAMP domain-containing sensor histidine kinase [Streptomyces actuosus]MBN0044653.1 HAMP domain-containing histidine kinase [Streptomyces actuosus]
MSRTRARVGLRTRLVLAFLLVAAVSAGTTAVLTYREARNAILDQAQNTAVSSFRDQVQQLPTSLPVEPASLREDLRRIARAGKPHPWVVFAEYGSLRLSSGTHPVSTVVTAALRTAALAHPRGSFQRVDRDGTPWLTVAVPTMFRIGKVARPTGLVLYAVMPLTDEEDNIRAMVTAARDGALPALALALLPALLAARSVLRPVRDLRTAAQNMGSGRLDTRIQVKGSDELAELARTFNESAVELERSVGELRDAEARARRFASDVSHELRTPLAGMLAVTEVLDEDADRLAPDTAAAVRLVSAETGKLAVLVEDLMEISRFDARAAELNTDEIDVAQAIRKTLTNRHWTDPAQVATDLPDGIRARLDPRRFDIVVANLVGNALRHGSAPVLIRLRATTGPGDATAAFAPEPGFRTAPDRLVVEVSDRGPGIDTEALPHVFERFYKADAARTRSRGSGLGLAITLENVRLHGGRVHAGNAPHGGAVFTVEIPLTGAGAAQ